MGWLLPAATGGHDVPMGGVRAMAAMRLDDHDAAALEGAAADPAEDISQALDSTAHESAHQDGGVVREGGASHGGYGEDDVPIEDALMPPVTHLAHPLIPSTLAQRKHSDDWQLMATRWVPSPPWRHRYAG